MKENEVGMTELYSMLHDQHNQTDEINNLRDLHVELYSQVIKSYKWDDLDADFHFSQEMDENGEVSGSLFTVSEPTRNSILSKLLKENQSKLGSIA